MGVETTENTSTGATAPPPATKGVPSAAAEKGRRLLTGFAGFVRSALTPNLILQCIGLLFGSGLVFTVYSFVTAPRPNMSFELIEKEVSECASGADSCYARFNDAVLIRVPGRFANNGSKSAGHSRLDIASERAENPIITAGNCKKSNRHERQWLTCEVSPFLNDTVTTDRLFLIATAPIDQASVSWSIAAEDGGRKGKSHFLVNGKKIAALLRGAPEPGTLSNGVYSNPFFGIKLTLPPGFLQAPSECADLVMKGLAHQAEFLSAGSSEVKPQAMFFAGVPRNDFDPAVFAVYTPIPLNSECIPDCLAHVTDEEVNSIVGGLSTPDQELKLPSEARKLKFHTSNVTKSGLKFLRATSSPFKVGEKFYIFDLFFTEIKGSILEFGFAGDEVAVGRTVPAVMDSLEYMGTPKQE